MSVREVFAAHHRASSYLVIALTAMGCATPRGPAEFLEPPAAAALDPYGGWIDVWTPPDSAGEEVRFSGELISVDERDVFLLIDSTLTVVAQSDVNRARVITYWSGWGPVAWAAGGTLLTASHGFYAVLSAPLWMLSAGLWTRTVAEAPVLHVPEHSWDEIAPFARFPQGLPPGLDPSRLRPKRRR